MARFWRHRCLWRTRTFSRGRWSVRLLWLYEPRDMWIGVYRDYHRGKAAPNVRFWDVYLSLIPCLPLKLEVFHVGADELPREMWRKHKPYAMYLEAGRAYRVRRNIKTGLTVVVASDD